MKKMFKSLFLHQNVGSSCGAVVPILFPRYGHGYKRQMLHLNTSIVEGINGTLLHLTLECDVMWGLKY